MSLKWLFGIRAGSLVTKSSYLCSRIALPACKRLMSNRSLLITGTEASLSTSASTSTPICAGMGDQLYRLTVVIRHVRCCLELYWWRHLRRTMAKTRCTRLIEALRKPTTAPRFFFYCIKFFLLVLNLHCRRCSTRPPCRLLRLLIYFNCLKMAGLFFLFLCVRARRRILYLRACV